MNVFNRIMAGAIITVMALAQPAAAREEAFEEDLARLEQLSQSGSWRAVEAGIGPLAARASDATPRQRARLDLLAARTEALAGCVDEAIDRLTTMLDERDGLDPDLELRALNLATNMLVINDRFESGFAYFRDAMALVSGVDNARMRADTFNVAADFHARIGEYATAIEFANLAMQQVNATEVPRQHCIALERRARARRGEQRLDAAAEDFARAIDLCQAATDMIFLGISHLGLGRIHHARGDDPAAEESFRTAIEALEQANYTDGLLEAYVELAALMMARGNFAAAESLIPEIEDRVESAGKHDARAHAYRVLSQLAERQGDTRRAYELFHRAIDHQIQYAETQRHMRLTLLLSDFDNQARQQELELLRTQNTAIDLDREQQRQGELAILYGGSGAVVAGILLSVLVWQTARDRKRFRQLSRRDGLTGLLNHTRFFELAQQSFQRARQTATPFSLIIADVDLFKQVNDQYGHLVGDNLLRRIGARFREAFGTDAIIGRLGGEEFGVALYDCGVDDAVARIEHLRAILNDHRADDEEPDVTMSFGVAELAREKSLNMLYAHADQALYDAKDAGRNRVITVARIDFGHDAFVT